MGAFIYFKFYTKAMVVSVFLFVSLGSTRIALTSFVGIWLLNVGSSIVVTGVGIFLKSAFDERIRGPDSDQIREGIRERSISPTFAPILIGSSNFIPNTIVTDKLYDIFNITFGGLFVIGAPSGAGKTTYFGHVMQRFYEDTKRPVFYFSGLTTDIMGDLSLSKSGMISKYFTDQSVLVIDQVDFDMDDFTAVQKQFLVKLMVQSRNLKSFHVIITVSKPGLMKAILDLNGHEKVMGTIHSHHFKWDREQLMKLAYKLLPQWENADELEQLVTDFAPFHSPGMMYVGTQMLSRTPTFPWDNQYRIFKHTMMIGDDGLNHAWKDFESFNQRVFEIS